MTEAEDETHSEHTGQVAIKNVNTIDKRRKKSLETEFFIAICRPTGDKWQSETQFLAIFYSSLWIVKCIFDCRLSLAGIRGKVKIKEGETTDAQAQENFREGKYSHGPIQRGGGGGGGGSRPPSPEKSQKLRVYLQYWSRSPENHKATKPAFNLGPLSARQRNNILMAFPWRAIDGPLIVVFGSFLPSSN